MSAAAVQLRLDGLPLDPVQLAELSAPDRGRLYAELSLDPPQRQVAEEAVRAVIAGTYRRRAARGNPDPTHRLDVDAAPRRPTERRAGR